jgi:flagellar motor switch protein FliN/FliY
MTENAFNTENPEGGTPEQEGEVIDAAARTRPRIHSADAVEPGIESEPSATAELGTDADLKAKTEYEKEVEGLNFLSDVPLRLNMVLGETTMSLGEVIALEGDSIVQLDKPSGDPVDIFVENQKLGTGEVIVLHEKLRIRLLEVTSPSREKEKGKIRDSVEEQIKEKQEE